MPASPDFEFFLREILTKGFFENTWEKKHHLFKNVKGNFFPKHFDSDRYSSTVLTDPDETVRCYRVVKGVNGKGGKGGKGSSGKDADDGDDDAATTINRSDPDPIRGYLAGGSLVQNRFDRKDKTLCDFCQFLGEKYFGHVFAVSYLTPSGGNQAVRAHSDDQDVFIIQLWGKKTWTLYEASPLLCFTPEMLGKEESTDKKLLKEDRIVEGGKDLVLEAGDILYMPRGLIHEAKTRSKNECEGTSSGGNKKGNKKKKESDEPSLHLTITVPSTDYCWAALMQNWTREVLQKEFGEGSGGGGSGGGKCEKSGEDDESTNASASVSSSSSSLMDAKPAEALPLRASLSKGGNMKGGNKGKGKSSESGQAPVTPEQYLQLPMLSAFADRDREKQFIDSLVEKLDIDALLKTHQNKMEQFNEKQKLALHSLIGPEGNNNKPFSNRSIKLHDDIEYGGVVAQDDEGKPVLAFRRGQATLTLSVDTEAVEMFERLQEQRMKDMNNNMNKAASKKNKGSVFRVEDLPAGGDEFRRFCLVQLFVGKGCLELGS